MHTTTTMRALLSVLHQNLEIRCVIHINNSTRARKIPESSNQFEELDETAECFCNGNRLWWGWDIVTCVGEFALILYIDVGQILGGVKRSGLGLADDLLRDTAIASQIQHVRHDWFSTLEIQCRSVQIVAVEFQKPWEQSWRLRGLMVVGRLKAVQSKKTGCADVWFRKSLAISMAMPRVRSGSLSTARNQTTKIRVRPTTTKMKNKLSKSENPQNRSTSKTHENCWNRSTT